MSQRWRSVATRQSRERLPVGEDPVESQVDHERGSSADKDEEETASEVAQLAVSFGLRTRSTRAH